MIHSTAIVSRKAEIGENVTIGPYTIIDDYARIGDGTTIESHCHIAYSTPLAEGMPLILGSGSLIRSHSIFYQGSCFGDKLVTGHRVTVRERVSAGINLQIGTLGDVQGDCKIGDYVRLHSSVFMGKYATIGDFVWLLPRVVLTHDPHPPSECIRGLTVEDFAVIASNAVILPGVRVGSHSLVAAHSLVNRDVPSHMVVAGVPARQLYRTSAIELKNEPGVPAYPWPRHFHRGYPEAVVNEWIKKFA